MRYLNGLNKTNRRIHQRAEYVGIQEDFLGFLTCKEQEYFFEKLIIGHISCGDVFHYKFQVHSVTRGQWICHGRAMGRRASFPFSISFQSSSHVCNPPPNLSPLFPPSSLLLSEEEDLLISFFRTKDIRILTGPYFRLGLLFQNP